MDQWRKNSHWFNTAVAVVNKALDGLPEGGTHSAKGEIVQAVADAYPFEQRTGWAYKQFLAARRMVLSDRRPDLWTPPRKRSGRGRKPPAGLPAIDLADDPKQTPMFEVC
jgi:hypothetical protein